MSAVPIRKEPTSTSELVSMLLFGESAIVNEQQGEWLRIETENEQYPGWVSNKQVSPLSHAPQHYQAVTDFPFAVVQGKDGLIMAPCGSQLPDPDAHEFMINNQPYRLSKPQQTLPASDINRIAKQFLNAPYLWGGRSPFGLDCSGFMQAVYKCVGIQLKRDAWQQAEMGSPVAFLEETISGDLAFFDNAEGRITHVGLMLDSQTIIHASGKVRIDPVDSYGILNTEEKQYSHKLRLIKRIL